MDQPLAKSVCTNFKAGMQNVDSDHVESIINEYSRKLCIQGSLHYKKELKRKKLIDIKVTKLKEKASLISTATFNHYTRKSNALISSLLAEADFNRIWIHVDLDAFFASVEELHCPDLKSKPMGVGSLSMLSTTNYLARQYGVRSAMPGFLGKKLCPALVIVKPNFSKYSLMSGKIMKILKLFDVNLESGGLDEAYLDVTDYCLKTGEQVATDIRDIVHRETGLTCSCGIAPNSMLAKICSDINKPNGQYGLPSDRQSIENFLAATSIRKVPGIGMVAEMEYNALGIKTCSDFLTKKEIIGALFSENTLKFVIKVGLGIGRSCHSIPLQNNDLLRKGISVERTYSPALDSKEAVKKCRELSKKLAINASKENLCGRTITLKLKLPSFEILTRSKSSKTFLCSFEEINNMALELLRADVPPMVRLIGLRLSALQSGGSLHSMQKRITPFSNSNLAEAHVSSQSDSAATKFLGCDYNKPPKAKWTCKLCTYAENSRDVLRCSICDQLRGTSRQSFASSNDEKLIAFIDTQSRSSTHKSSRPLST